MNRDDIIRMAREAGMPPALIVSDTPVLYPVSDAIERFAALVEQNLIANGYRKCAVGQRTSQFCGQLEAAVAAENEACEKIVNAAQPFGRIAETVAAIRARRKK